MEWKDQGIILSSRRHGETAAIVSILTSLHGRHVGLMRGGSSRKGRSMLQIGNSVSAVWRARLEEHLGNFNLEVTDSPSALILYEPDPLAALSAACAVAESSLPEREPANEAFEGLQSLLQSLPTNKMNWTVNYVKWELNLLETLGFGLDLNSCAATGSTEDLAYVSPKSGRAVSRNAGLSFVKHLLPLPQFLTNSSTDANRDSILQGLRLTGYFLRRFVYNENQPIPPARLRLETRLKTSQESFDV